MKELATTVESKQPRTSSERTGQVEKGEKICPAMFGEFIKLNGGGQLGGSIPFRHGDCFGRGVVRAGGRKAIMTNEGAVAGKNEPSCRLNVWGWENKNGEGKFRPVTSEKRKLGKGEEKAVNRE